METILRYVIIAAVGALASILANQSIAVFNDGLRPVLPEYLEKRMDRKALAATSFAIGFGLVIGYGLPTSIAASIILIHCILLTTDIIGTWCPDTKKGMIASGVIGAVYGVALLFGLQVIIDLFNPAAGQLPGQPGPGLCRYHAGLRHLPGCDGCPAVRRCQGHHHRRCDPAGPSDR